MSKLMQSYSFRAVFPILLGGLIYIFCRDIRSLKVQDWLPVFEHYKAPFTNMPGLLKYNAPDGLWLLGLLGFIDLIWKEQRSYWSLALILFAFCSECLQLRCLPGTFDFGDLLAYTIAIGINSIFNAYSFHKNTHLCSKIFTPL